MLKKELAAALGISAAMVTKLAQRGMPTDSVERAQRWRRRHLEPGRVKGVRADTRAATDAHRAPAPSSGSEAARTDASGRQPEADVSEYHAARTRREAAEAERAELRLREERGEVIRVDAVNRELAGVFVKARDALLLIPTRVSQTLAAESDAGKVQELLSAEIHQALTQLASTARTGVGAG